MRDSASEDDLLASDERGGRRLSDKILTAFHHACDQHDLEVARRLLTVMDSMTQRSVVKDRRIGESLVAAHERLWDLCHPSYDPE